MLKISKVLLFSCSKAMEYKGKLIKLFYINIELRKFNFTLIFFAVCKKT